MVKRIHPATDETLQRIAAALEARNAGDMLEWDAEDGCYTNESVFGWLRSMADGKLYGVSIPKGSAVACTKTAANAGIAAPVPGTIGTPAVDPYTGLGPFVHFDVNGYADADGTPHVTAIEGDGNFRRDGSNGDVWVLAPKLWWSMSEGDGEMLLSVSDSRLPGLSAQPGLYLPSGAERPYMLYAKYAGVKGTDNYMHSYSGRPAWNRSISHDSLITACRNASTGYSGKSVADDWYVKAMFLLKYATKDSQSAFKGCTSYDFQYAPAVAEEGVTRVILANAQAANLLVGSAVMLGTHAGNNNRNTASNYNIFDAKRISGKEAYDADRTAVYIETTESFDTATTYLLSTSPWWTGSCDAVEGDGSPTDNSSGKEPCVIQGIELFVGLWEVLGDVIVSNDGSSGFVPYINRDSAAESTSLTSAYASSGKALPTDSSDSWKYPLYPEDGSGLLFGTTSGGSSSTGLCDGHYTQKLATTGTREWRSLGYLNDGGYAGVWACTSNGALGYADWYIGSRLSCTGRSRG